MIRRSPDGSGSFARLFDVRSPAMICRTLSGLVMSLLRIVLVWLLLAVLMIANVILREAILVRILGRDSADVASVALGILIILAATRPFLRHVSAASSLDLARISVIWLAMTVAFEFSFGHYVDHKTWSELAENYAIWRGRLFILVLVALGAAPFIWSRGFLSGAMRPRQVG
jgi:hypothetical protein